ncbi:MAG TPA: hypothetical protein VNY05_07620 [Candidatus Acidoferrales bacterium]|jgi:hypothetical protein|nr:hypothetical protein [Candidatus Acidoferrales bacterium]
MKALCTILIWPALLWSAGAQDAARLPARQPAAWRLVWSDEFAGQAGSPPNRAIWTCDLGPDRELTVAEVLPAGKRL